MIRRGPLLLLALLCVVIPVDASWVNCTSHAECESVLRKGSECIDGYCTNPFYQGGCLKSLLPNWNKTRICNSQDPPEAAELGYCRPSPLDYAEIRLAGGNWESINFGAWVLQILLSEVLDVPTSIEGGYSNVSYNLYDKNDAFDYWWTVMGNHGEELQVANRVKDCQLVSGPDVPPEEYEACIHVNSEYWWETVEDKNALKNYGLEAVRELGAMGEEGLHIPLFAAIEDPSLVSYVGLMGEKNRRKLAETFKTPTRWKQYCEEISPTNCTEPDPLAQRAPMDSTEEDSFFVEGLYNGHFRMTDKNDCDKNPTNCTGHITDYPCDWGTYVKQQTYHLNIALEGDGPQNNGGYAYEEMVQIWQASNATKQPVMMMWWTPEPLYESFAGTDSQFIRVSFPAPTQECVDARVDWSTQCNENTTFEQFVGDPAGICDTYPYVLQKGIGLALREITMNPDVPEEFWSPAYGAVENYRLSNLHLSKIFEYWLDRGTDKWNFDPRDAACRWAAENIDILNSFVPDTHPRVLHETDNTAEELFKSARGLAILAILMVVASIAITVSKRATKVLYYIQPEFLYLLLVGMLLVTLGAVLLAVAPSDESCSAISWLTNLGYVFQLVPLLVRISAINQLATSGKQMQRVRLQLTRLFASVAAVGCLVGVFLIIWSLVDAPERNFEFELMDTLTPQNETVVDAVSYCGSENEYWYLATYGWMALFLLPSCFIAFLANRVKEDMNDTTAMSMTLYAHTIFLGLQVILFLSLGDSKANLMAYTSIILSADTIVSLGIYVVPKFFASGEKLEAEPLPDVFVHTTISLIDVVGFTAWSSVREPVQVFQFLEELYGNLDKLAEQHNVYKVETVGECYVAATGIPKAQANHAVLMAKFAADCTKKMPKVLKGMEVKFGPDTADLTLRVALHSGPVTGGFLKGKGARFQLFGDTMTTASLVQANGMSNRIHISEATAELLIAAGKRQWVMEREDKVNTLEKGEMKTFWLVKNGLDGRFDTDFTNSSMADPDEENDEFSSLKSEQRWIEWNVEVFKNLLKQIVAQRSMTKGVSEYFRQPSDVDLGIDEAEMPLEEVKEIIELPKFDKRAARRQQHDVDVELPTKVVQQLKEYITEIAMRYQPNPFHNFAHASYVVMAVTKYMNRIIAAKEMDLGDDEDRNRSRVKAALHDHTYGITSDPLTQFACVFSALIHDVDHPGVPNPQLIKEDEQVAERYKKRSVAEQKSLDISWDLLMEDRFNDLRATICCNSDELRRFRQLVVNSVMATDLGDAKLKALRNGRWDKAFLHQGDSSNTTDGLSAVSAHTHSTGTGTDEEAPRERKSDRINRKATIVIEHLIQAADVAHMSQHWNVYRKWNERLFREVYKAYRQGRAESNPADNWYKGEIGFFDFYIIPLSKKLRDCGVFGPTSDENLNYAMSNRKMWEKDGQEIVKQMLEEVERDYNEAEAHPEAPRKAQPVVFPIEIEC